MKQQSKWVLQKLRQDIEDGMECKIDLDKGVPVKIINLMAELHFNIQKELDK